MNKSPSRRRPFGTIESHDNPRIQSPEFPYHEHPGRIRLGPESLDQRGRSIRVEHLHLFPLDFRRLDGGGLVADKFVPGHRLCQGLLENPVHVHHRISG